MFTFSGVASVTEVSAAFCSESADVCKRHTYIYYIYICIYWYTWDIGFDLITKSTYWYFHTDLMEKKCQCQS